MTIYYILTDSSTCSFSVKGRLFSRSHRLEFLKHDVLQIFEDGSTLRYSADPKTHVHSILVHPQSFLFEL